MVFLGQKMKSISDRQDLWIRDPNPQFPDLFFDITLPPTYFKRCVQNLKNVKKTLTKWREIKDRHGQKYNEPI